MFYLVSIFKVKGKGGFVFEKGNVVGIEGKTPQFYINRFNLRVKVDRPEGYYGSTAL